MTRPLWTVLVCLMPALVQAQAFPGPVTVDFSAPQHVICDSGCSSEGGTGLTDAQLRASAVPVSVVGNVTFSNTSIAVTGTFWQATQPVSGTFWQATQPVSGTVTVQDGGGALTVDGTVACSNCGGAVGTPFQCAMTSTATTSTVVTNCGAPGANLTRYVTDISYASSIIATTTNFMSLQYGTGTNCGTGTAVVWRMFNNAAFVPVIGHGMTQPIKLGTNTDLCFVHPGTGTRVLNIQGYVAAP